MSDAWTRHERPDGHRSLWFKASHWIVLHGDLESGATSDLCSFWKCPLPTAADLAWLRGE